MSKCGKVRYKTELDAERALLLLQSRPDPNRQECRTYQCSKCLEWHLTSVPEGKTRHGILDKRHKTQDEDE